MPSASRGKASSARRGRPGGRGARFVAVAAGVVALAAGGMWLTRTPRARPDAEPAHVLIPVHASFHEAADSLAATHLIRWPVAFSIYGTFTHRDRACS